MADGGCWSPRPAQLDRPTRAAIGSILLRSPGSSNPFKHHSAGWRRSACASARNIGSQYLFAYPLKINYLQLILKVESHALASPIREGRKKIFLESAFQGSLFILFTLKH